MMDILDFEDETPLFSVEIIDVEIDGNFTLAFAELEMDFGLGNWFWV
jgi:hypothetical protein